MSFAIAGALVGAYAGIGSVGILAGAALGAVGGTMLGGAASGAEAQKKANAQAQEAAARQAKAADEAMNAANRKKPDTLAILEAAQAGSSGPSGTMLTGPQGIDKNAMSLGKSTLLGM